MIFFTDNHPIYFHKTPIAKMRSKTQQATGTRKHKKKRQKKYSSSVCTGSTTRTHDTWFWRPVLYQLSYARFSKADANVKKTITYPKQKK